MCILALSTPVKTVFVRELKPVAVSVVMDEFRDVCVCVRESVCLWQGWPGVVRGDKIPSLAVKCGVGSVLRPGPASAAAAALQVICQQI